MVLCQHTKNFGVFQMNMSDALCIIKGYQTRCLLVRYDHTKLPGIIKAIDHAGIELIEPAFMPSVEAYDLFDGLRKRHSRTIAFAYCRKMLKSQVASNILASAIDEAPRVVSWKSAEVSESFEYSGKIILVTNEEVHPVIKARSFQVTI